MSDGNVMAGRLLPGAFDSEARALQRSFFERVERGDAKGALECLARGADVNGRDPFGRGAALEAVLGQSKIGMLLFLAAAGCDLDDPDQNGSTALMWSAMMGREACVRVMLGHGCDPRARGHGRMTPLLRAAQGGSVECVDLLLAAGASLAERCDSGLNALMWAAKSGKLALVEHFAKMDGVMDAAGPDGQTPRDWARRAGYGECAAIMSRVASMREREALDEAVLVRGGRSEGLRV
jgi:ankyrin repeat protein